MVRALQQLRYRLKFDQLTEPKPWALVAKAWDTKAVLQEARAIFGTTIQNITVELFVEWKESVRRWSELSTAYAAAVQWLAWRSSGDRAM